jgi:F-type H+-transporting ATPase subunit alpha
VELAQYRELAAFAQFGSDLSQDTLERLRHGERIVETLKQPQYKPMPVEEQVLVLYVLTNKLLSDVKVEDITEVKNEMIDFIRRGHLNILNEIREKKIVDTNLEDKIKTAVSEFIQGR